MYFYPLQPAHAAEITAKSLTKHNFIPCTRGLIQTSKKKELPLPHRWNLVFIFYYYIILFEKREKFCTMELLKFHFTLSLQGNFCQGSHVTLIYKHVHNALLLGGYVPGESARH